MKKKWQACSKTKKRILAVCGITGVIGIIMVAAFLVYVSIYYRADEIALAAYEEGITNGEIIEVDNITIISPEEPSGVGIVFYPGAKVEHLAYIPILTQLAEEGITVVLMEMPFNMAIFDVNAADDVWAFIDGVEQSEAGDSFDDNILDLVNIEHWYMMGHSMGGAMASSYASEHQELLGGLILIGAYVYGEYPTEDALTIYGTFNDNLEENIDYTDNIVIIEGGNHAQYGNYGKQDGDPDATISDVEQQEITVDAIVDFIFSAE